MAGAVFVGNVRFEMDQVPIEVTSAHRPDMVWSRTDTAGHAHCWYIGTMPAFLSYYRPEIRYDTPTLIWIKDGVGYWEDGEPYDIGHYECRQCGEHIEPGYRADDTKQFIGGLKSFYIDGEPVEEEEFQRRLNEEIAKHG